MLLTLTTTHSPATDLGFLLHKHPGRVHDATIPFGTARVVYPDASEERWTAALIVDVDPALLPVSEGGLEQLLHGSEQSPRRSRSVAYGGLTYSYVW
jgi:hypothetical protein